MTPAGCRYREVHDRTLASDRKSGPDRFHTGGLAKDFNLLDFWQWSAADIVSNTTRGVLAEYIVGRAVGVPTGEVRDPWSALDLETPDGIKIEVKSSAYVQSWGQSRLSSVSFGTSAARAWDPVTGAYSAASRRIADVYIFALLSHQTKETIDPMNLDQWEFYVLSTEVLDALAECQKTITLGKIKMLASPSVPFDRLADAVRRVCPEANAQ